jgi:hypothetical protein
MSSSDTLVRTLAWPHSLRFLLHLGALLLLCPLYWQMAVPAAAVLLGLVQGLIAAGSVHEWRSGQTYRYRMKPEDWVPAACGGFILEVNCRLHGKGHDPDVKILAEAETARRLVDQQGNIHVFSDRPLCGLIEVCRRSGGIRGREAER